MEHMEIKTVVPMPDSDNDKKLQTRATLFGTLTGLASSILGTIIILPMWQIADWLFSQGDNPAPRIALARSEWGSFLIFLGPPTVVFC
jgi:hypothetical protein